ncbi:MAG: PAS domain S-box protein [Kordiimonadaceae bacterium]|nr:PAS domain S-box protein [Kordiimonadaceae bacterium]
MSEALPKKTQVKIPEEKDFDLFDKSSGFFEDDDDFIDDVENEKAAKKLKRFLAETEERMGMLLELMPIGLALHQPQSIVFANEELGRLVGFAPEAIIGRHCLDFVDPDGEYDLFERFSRVFENDESINEPTLNIVDSFGRPKTVQFIAGRMPWQGQPLAQVLIQDVSHIKIMEYELQRKTEEIAASLFQEVKARETQREFVSVVSHEFRTPLAIINGSAQMIERLIKADKSERAVEKVAKIRNAVGRINRLIDNILDSSSIEKNQFKIEPKPFDLGAPIETLVKSCAEINETYTLNLNLEGLPDLIDADEKACRHIIENLLSNAVKYSPQANQVDITGWHKDGYTYVSVKDFGVGIPENEVGKLFNQYFRASTSVGISGTGIGLNLVKNLVALHKGEITVESKLEEGSIFTFSLPDSETRNKE